MREGEGAYLEGEGVNGRERTERDGKGIRPKVKVSKHTLPH